MLLLSESPMKTPPLSQAERKLWQFAARLGCADERALHVACRIAPASRRRAATASSRWSLLYKDLCC